MAKVNTLLNERLKKTERPSKMTAMADQSAHGQLTSFSGIFSITDLSLIEKNKIEEILKTYAIDTDSDSIGSDLTALLSITSEVKAINNQAALLHGERVKKAHSILTRYRDGAFTAWMIAAYGNRQTPYNLMQYYEFCEALPRSMRPQIESMPRQAIYTLASREGLIERKQTIVENYQGETKAELLNRIREAFPLDNQDKRKRNSVDGVIELLKKSRRELKGGHSKITSTQRAAMSLLLEELQRLIAPKTGGMA